MKVFVIFDNPGRIKGTAAIRLGNVAVGNLRQIRIHTIAGVAVE